MQQSSISCEFCRSQHRRCSKTKPSCYSCSIRGVECVYGNGKRTKKNTYETISNFNQMITIMKVVPPTPPSQSIPPPSLVHSQPSMEIFPSSEIFNLKQNQNQQNQNRGYLENLQIIEFYFDVACFAHPIVSRTELEQFVNISGQLSLEGLDYDTPFMNEMAALFYSIKTVCEITQGKSIQSEETAKIAKRYLSNIFSNYTSFYVAGAYIHMCVYEQLFERVDNAQLYFRILQFFKKSLFKNSNTSLTEYQINVKKAIFYLEKIVCKVDQNLKQTIAVEDFLEIIPDLYVFNHASLPSGWDLCLKQPITSENCLEIWTLVELILTQAKLNTPYKGNADLTDLYYKLAENGSRIALLSKRDVKTPIIEISIEASAYYITQCLDNPRFSLLPFEVLIHVSYAAQYHLQRVSTGIITNNGINYLDLLRKELCAYNSLKSKYRIVAFHFSKVFNEIENLLNQQNTHLTFIH